MKKIIILKSGGGELANQLWNYASIYAYALEVGATVRNPSFFEYHSFFRFLPRESLATRFSTLFFRTPRRRYHLVNRIGRTIYAVRVKTTRFFNPRNVFSSENNENRSTYLPPTEPLPEQYTSCDPLYTIGWLFRNPKGLDKHRDEIVAAFAPVDRVQKRIKEIIEPLRQKYENIIGIHIRQSDYAAFKGGKYLVTQKSVREAIDRYAKRTNLDLEKTIFIVASDGSIDRAEFEGLNIMISKENAVTDLFLLAQTNVILGSHSTFNGFAAWYGGIERIFFEDCYN